MRLIDADKIKEELKLKELSHIIKQEEYLDYVLNEWKTRVVEFGSYNVVEEIDNAPTVKAIPIEWMYEWRMKNNEQYNVGVSSFSQMISDWEKENDSDDTIRI